MTKRIGIAAATIVAVMVTILLANAAWSYNTPCPKNNQNPSNCKKCSGPSGPPPGGPPPNPGPPPPPPPPSSSGGNEPDMVADPVSMTGPDVWEYKYDFKLPLPAGNLWFRRHTILLPGFWEIINGSDLNSLGGLNAQDTSLAGVPSTHSDWVPKPFGSWHHDGTLSSKDALPNALVWHNLMSLVFLRAEPGPPSSTFDPTYQVSVFDTNNYMSLWLKPASSLTTAQFIPKRITNGSGLDSNFPGELYFTGYVDGGLKPDGGPAYALNPDGGTEFVLFREGEGRYTYAAAYATDYDKFYNLAPRRFFLTAFDPLQYGGSGYRISYSLPAGCPIASDAGTPGAPYINEVTDPDGGSRVRFVWKQVPTLPATANVGVPPTECVIDHIDVFDSSSSSWVQQAQYSYAAAGHDDGGWVQSAALANVNTETYTIGSSSYVRSIDGLSHTYGLNPSGLVTSLNDFDTSMTIGIGTGTQWERDIVWTTGSGAPDGGTAIATEARFQDQFNSGWHGMGYRASDAGCNPLSSCSPGQILNVQGNHNTYGSYYMATLNKRGFYHSYNEVGGAATGQGFDTAPEVRTVTWGGSTSTGTGAIETHNYSYTYGGWNQSPRYYEQLHLTSYRASNSGTGNAVRNEIYEDGGAFTNRLKADIRLGFVLNSDGTTWADAGIGTFYLTKHSACDATADDPYGRTLEVHGPCAVGDNTATDCTGTYPVKTFTYYGGNGSGLGNKANRLASVTKYPNGSSCGTALTTTYDDYDALGHVISITDTNNGTTTTYDYKVAGAVTPLLRSMTVDTGVGHLNLTTTMSYDDGKLSKVVYPKGNAEVFCYRAETSPTNLNCSTTAPLTEKPVYSAKTDNSGNWSELVQYVYNVDGELAKATFWSCVSAAGCSGFPDGSASYEKRRVEKYAFDAHHRPTWEGWGDNDGQFGRVRFFDRESNLAGVSLPSIGTAPAFCGGPSGSGSSADNPLSTLCASLGNDAANRLSSLSVYPAGSGTPQVTCFSHEDNQGNITAVLPGQTSTSACTGTISTNAASTKYIHDDFGRLAGVFGSWAGSGSGSRGLYVYQYDPMGNVVKAFTPTLGATDHLEYTYDSLGRQLTAGARQSGTLNNLYTFTWDTATSTCGGASANAYGKLASKTDASGFPTSGAVFYQYDKASRLTKEQRRLNCTGTPYSQDTNYSFDSNGNLTQIQYPTGVSGSTQDSRTVTYTYANTVSADRVSSVSVTRREAGAWVSHSVVDSVAWEPYGGLRRYVATPPTSGAPHFVVENILGDNGSTVPSGAPCPALPSAANSDLTGRLRGIWVSAGDAGTPVGDIYKRSYTWQGDEPIQVDTCFLKDAGCSTSQRYSYDFAGQLVGNDGGYPQTGTGTYSFAIDGRGNRTSWSSTAGANAVTTSYGYGVSGNVPDRLMSLGRAETLFDAGSASSGRNYAWDNDGRITQEVFDAGGGNTTVFNYSYLDGVGTTFQGYQVGGGWYFANVDAFGRRVTKNYPSGAVDFFTYDLGHQMLEDRGNNSLVSPTNFPIDDYVWLGGRPILVVRGQLTTSLAWNNDTTASCGRNDDPNPPACGFYYVVTDHLGAPVLVLDSNGKVTASQDYDAFGYVNRGQLAAQVKSVGASAFQFGVYKVPNWPGFVTDTRTKFSVYTEGSTANVGLQVPGSGIIATLSGSSTSPAWTPYGTVPAAAANPADTQLWMTPGGTGSYAVVAEAYDFRRHQSGANYFSVPLRFPGQYYDSETDHLDNWNRYVDPQVGRFLSSEPFLQSPAYANVMTRIGMGVSSYNYAANNPVNWYDATGLDVTNNTSQTIWVKPEDPDKPLVMLPPGETYPFPQDGFTDPNRPGVVYKTGNNVDACINDKGDIKTRVSPKVSALKSPVYWGYNFMFGGFKDSTFVAKHPDWKPLYDKSEPGRKGPFFWP